MQVILLERIEKLGELGDAVVVKAGYARNFLLPQGKALRATEENVKRFEAEKAQRVANNEANKSEAQKLCDKLNDKEVVVIRAASEAGHLYGSVTARDISNAVSEAHFVVDKRCVVMANPIKMLGIFDFRLALHPEASATIKVNVAQSKEEAKLQSDRVSKGLPALLIGEDEEDKLKEIKAKEAELKAAEVKAAETETEGEGEAKVEDEVGEGEVKAKKSKAKSKAKVKAKAKAKASEVEEAEVAEASEVEKVEEAEASEVEKVEEAEASEESKT